MPSTKFVRRDFLLKDLAVTVAGGGRGGTWMPGPDDETPPSPISPFAAVTAHLALIEGVRATVVEAVKAKRLDEVARAFVAGDSGGNATLRDAIQQIGSAVVASAAFAALGTGGAGLPNPECGGTSYETIPPTLTPVVHRGLAVHRVNDLPRLKQQLTDAVAYLDRAAGVQAPRGTEIAGVRTNLEGALKELPQR